MRNEVEQRIQELWAVYECEDIPAVEGFLRAHAEILPYVEQSEGKIREFFPDSELHLAVELDEDEEGGNAEEKLFLLIEAPEDLGEALSQLERLDEEWSVDVCEATGDRLVIDLKY